MSTLQLEEASNTDILKILKQTRTIWSGGLGYDKCIHSIQQQLGHPWGRRHLHYLTLKSEEVVVASLKLYSICISSRSKRFNLAGLGAIYTMAEHRNKGFAGNLVKMVIELAEKEDLDGLLLYSDIDPSFYSQLGFNELGSYNFEVSPKETSSFDAQITSLESEHIPFLSRSYDRWLSRRSYGCTRSTMYWQYKIARENFFHEFSKDEWPGLKLLTLDKPESGFDSYALIENSSKALRVLEIVGCEEQIWSQILAFAKQKGLAKIRGFEGSASIPKGGQLVERDWAKPMLLPLNPALDSWLEAQPCPLLELDHF